MYEEEVEKQGFGLSARASVLTPKDLGPNDVLS